MKPVLFPVELGGHAFSLHTYGLAVALGFAAGITLAARQARRLHMDPGDILDLAFWILVCGVIGARLLFVAQNAPEYYGLCVGANRTRELSQVLTDCTAALRVWEGGLVFYGGALTATLVAALTAHRRGWAFGKVADAFAPSLALGHSLGRLGCFAAGCCFGKACPPLWLGHGAVSFPQGSVAFDELTRHGLARLDAGATPPLHPTQLYEAAGELLIFFLLLALRGRQRTFGTLALWYAVLYASFRSVIEIFRGDVARRFLMEIDTPSLAVRLGLPAHEPLFLSTSQALSFLVGACALWGLWALRRQTAAH